MPDPPVPEELARVYLRVLGFVRKCLHQQSEASPESVAQSIFLSFAKEADELQRLLVEMTERPDDVMPLFLKNAKRHIDKHNARTRPSRRKPVVSLHTSGKREETTEAPPIEAVDQQPGPEAEAEFNDWYRNLISQLSEKHQKVFQMLFERHTVEQIAIELGVARKTIQRDRAKIITILQASLTEADSNTALSEQGE